jgi:parallel beta-helix repeat protein
MKFKSTIYSLMFLLVFQYACENKESTEIAINPENFEKDLQTKLIEADSNSVFTLPEGKFDLKRSISLHNTNGITIRGAGKGKTILSFKDQVDGAEGLLIKGSRDLTLEGFSVYDSKGDAIKVQECQNVIMRDLETTWTNGKLATNGAYGLYPVSCTGVLMEKCEASYAMDAGIYVGQSTNVIVRDNYAHHNVAGLEIENTICAEVYNNKATENAGGMLIFDMPDLPQVNGDKIKFYSNIIENNNGENFAPKGMVVSTIPPGSGMIIMAHTNIEFYNNTITNHKTLGIAINSWLLTGVPYKSEEYNPFCNNIFIHDNKISGTQGEIDVTTDFGMLLSGILGGKPVDIVMDGIFSPQNFSEDGSIKGFCFRNNGDVKFVSFNMYKGQKPEEIMANKSSDISMFDCKLPVFDTSCHNSWLNK